MNDAMIGEYFRVFICYGVIAMSWQCMLDDENTKRKR